LAVPGKTLLDAVFRAFTDRNGARCRRYRLADHLHDDRGRGIQFLEAQHRPEALILRQKLVSELVLDTQIV
jgi:hypothetical protein